MIYMYEKVRFGACVHRNNRKGRKQYDQRRVSVLMSSYCFLLVILLVTSQRLTPSFSFYPCSVVSFSQSLTSWWSIKKKLTGARLADSFKKDRND